MTDVVLDSGALSMFADGDPRLLAVLEAAQRDGGIAYFPTVCLVESLTGLTQDANLNHRLKGTRPVALNEADAREAATRRAAVDTSDVADPVVVTPAARLNCAVLTTDLSGHLIPRQRQRSTRGSGRSASLTKRHRVSV